MRREMLSAHLQRATIATPVPDVPRLATFLRHLRCHGAITAQLSCRNASRSFTLSFFASQRIKKLYLLFASQTHQEGSQRCNLWINTQPPNAALKMRQETLSNATSDQVQCLPRPTRRRLILSRRCFVQPSRGWSRNAAFRFARAFHSRQPPIELRLLSVLGDMADIRLLSSSSRYISNSNKSCQALFVSENHLLDLDLTLGKFPLCRLDLGKNFHPTCCEIPLNRHGVKSDASP